ncbi:hypothetical protein [Bacillus sp. T33-2]|nr:hypothetical protein [Bacillus sp. T33-2]
MRNNEVIELAKRIVELDLLRDQTWKEFVQITGDRAYELFRMIQNN